MEHKVEVYGKEQIWTENRIDKKNEIKVVNFHMYASDCYLIFDRNTKELKKGNGFAFSSETKYLEEIKEDEPEEETIDCGCFEDGEYFDCKTGKIKREKP